jgi:hypothetical protein
MGLNFPNAPTVGQVFPAPPVAGVPLWRWDGTVWAMTGGPVRPVVRGQIQGLTLSTAGSSATFSVDSGIACDSTGVDMLVLAAPISKTTATWALGSGNGALDTGAIANSTFYHVFLIKRPDTGVVGVLISLSPTAPTLPANYTLFRRIGAMLTTSTGLWRAFSQIGDEFLWAATIQDANAQALNVASRQPVTLTVPIGIQVTAMMRVTVAGAANCLIILTSYDETDQAAAGVGSGVNARTTAASDAGSGQHFVRTDTLGRIGVRSSAAGSLYVSTYGWIDRRNKDA